MPEDPAGTLGDISNKYGQIRYYQYVKTDQLYNTNEWTWTGISENTEYSQKIFTSRIFINLETIQKIVNDLSSKGTSKFTLNVFLKNIANFFQIVTSVFISEVFFNRVANLIQVSTYCP
jgi:phosphoribulokinase